MFPLCRHRYPQKERAVAGMPTEGVSVALQPHRPAELVDDDETGVLVGGAGPLRSAA